MLDEWGKVGGLASDVGGDDGTRTWCHSVPDCFGADIERALGRVSGNRSEVQQGNRHDAASIGDSRNHDLAWPLQVKRGEHGIECGRTGTDKSCISTTVIVSKLLLVGSLLRSAVAKFRARGVSIVDEPSQGLLIGGAEYSAGGERITADRFAPLNGKPS
jgi:hypothetical protein